MLRPVHSSSINQLPTEMLERIFEYAADPSINRVCKLWHEKSNHFDSTLRLLKENQGHLGIEREVKQALELKNAEEAVRQLAKSLLDRLSPLATENELEALRHLSPSYPILIQLLTFEKDRNLLLAFKEIANQNTQLHPLFKDPIFKTGSTFQKASHMRLSLSAMQEQLASVEEINLNNKNLTLIPQELNLLTGVTQVELALNSIRKIPEGFGSKWTELQSLHLSDNKIEELPLNFGQSWTKIERLFLYANALSHLPSDFGNSWTNLTNLLLQKNVIAELPQGFGKTWKALLELNLFHNQLACLPDQFGANWQPLTVLNLKGNSITIEITHEMKKQWPKLLRI